MKKIMLFIMALALLLVPAVWAPSPDWLGVGNWTLNDTTNFNITPPNSTCACAADSSANISVTTTGLTMNMTGSILINASFNVSNLANANRAVQINVSFPVSAGVLASGTGQIVNVYNRSSGLNTSNWFVTNASRKIIGLNITLGNFSNTTFNIEFNLSVRPTGYFLNTTANYYNFVATQGQNDINLTNVSYWFRYSDSWAIVNETVEARFYENSTSDIYREITTSSAGYNYTLDQINNNLSFVAPTLNASTRFFRAQGWLESDIKQGVGSGGGGGSSGRVESESILQVEQNISQRIEPTPTVQVEKREAPGIRIAVLAGFVVMVFFVIIVYRFKK